MTTRKTPDAREGARAMPEETWKRSAEAERRLDALIEQGLPDRDTPLPRSSEQGEEQLSPALRKAVGELDENTADQSRVGLEAHGDNPE
jgi:hypothetical protein